MSKAPMDSVARQYEAYPYPARDPADEARRLIVGSPSHPVEIDHFLFGGRRDWSKPFRALVAGGGTGDGLIMLAQLLSARGTPADIHYLDLSSASRGVAEARARARKLANITFHSGDLLSAPDLGPFDYVDCCGVLHHLPDPQAGFDALARALSPDGGIGAMVYAPYGRAGLYELQAALRPLVDGETPERQVALAKEFLSVPPSTNGFVNNPHLRDHHDSDAGLYDLLLHSRDRPYDAPALLQALDRAGLRLAGWVEPARYAPESYLHSSELRRRAAELPVAERYAMAERLAGNLKTHMFYASPKSRGETLAKPNKPDLTPVLHRLQPQALAQTIARRGAITFNVDGLKLSEPFDKSLAEIAGMINGRRALGELQQARRMDWLGFSSTFKKLYRPLDGYNGLRFSRFLAGAAR